MVPRADDDLRCPGHLIYFAALPPHTRLPRTVRALPGYEL